MLGSGRLLPGGGGSGNPGGRVVIFFFFCTQGHIINYGIFHDPPHRTGTEMRDPPYLKGSGFHDY